MSKQDPLPKRPAPAAIPLEDHRPFWARIARRVRSTLRHHPLASCFSLVAVILLAVLLVIAATIVFPGWFTGESPATAITVTATRPPGDPGLPHLPGDATLPGLNQLRIDPSQRYAFPLAAAADYFTWTHTTRSFPNAVIIEARAGLSQSEYDQVMRVPVVAVTNGLARVVNNDRDGLGYLLQGDDGTDYAYAHLEAQWIADGARVTMGQALGLPGTTGSARYSERQLRFWLGPRDTVNSEPPALNAAEWLQTTFGLPWAERSTVDIPNSWPSGYPVLHERFIVVTTYNHSTDRGSLPEPALEFGFTGAPPTVPQNVYATLDGTVNVIRWTEPYGTRIQITNEAASFTTIVSGLESWLVEDGQAVTRGTVIGLWNPANRPRLHYMIYQFGVNIDPESTLD